MRQWTLALIVPFSACASNSGSTGATTTNALPVGSVGLNEVSALLPLPRNQQEADLMIKPSNVGSKGQTMPDWLAPRPTLVQSEDRETTIKNLRVVATRLDPCWPSIAETDLTRCQRVLHVIWQPIVPAWETGATTMAGADAGLHTFHRLSDSEFSELLREIIALNAPDPLDARTPLKVHLTIASQGLSGSYWAGLKSLIEKYAGGDNAFEMTFLALRANTSNSYLGRGWLLAGMNFGNGQQSRVPVATTNDNEEHFGNNEGGSVEDATTFLGDFTPTSANTTALLGIVGDSTKAQTAPLADIQAAVDVALKSENPLLNTLDSIECMTCHVATTARNWAEKNRDIDTSTSPYRYTNKNFDLTLVSDSATRTNAIHGLGWYGVHSCISQRTVNDTAAGADFINANLSRRQ